LILKPFSEEDLLAILKNALSDKQKGFGILDIKMDTDVLRYLVSLADGDARNALNNLEAIVSMVQNLPDDKKTISLQFAQDALLKKSLLYDKDGEEHYNLISALHKSMRGSDPDAALYWLGRMLAAGEDPLYIARRMIRFASEDIGNADPQALVVAMAAQQAFHFIGLPEGELALAQAAVYLATAPKSNALYTGYGKVKHVINTKGYLPVPLHIRNAPTKLMKELDYGKDYKYAHDYENGYVPQDYLPEEIKGELFYQPKGVGFEKTIVERLNYWRKKKKEGENK
jgi:putative ATPase